MANDKDWLKKRKKKMHQEISSFVPAGVSNTSDEFVFEGQDGDMLAGQAYIGVCEQFNPANQNSWRAEIGVYKSAGSWNVTNQIWTMTDGTPSFVAPALVNVNGSLYLRFSSDLLVNLRFAGFINSARISD